MGYRPQDQHIPEWAKSIAGIVRSDAELRFLCPKCWLLFDVDARVLMRLFGPGYSLVEKRARCKVSLCRKQGFFLAAMDEDATAIPLLHADPFSVWGRTWKLKDFAQTRRAPRS